MTEPTKFTKEILLSHTADIIVRELTNISMSLSFPMQLETINCFVGNNLFRNLQQLDRYINSDVGVNFEKYLRSDVEGFYLEALGDCKSINWVDFVARHSQTSLNVIKLRLVFKIWQIMNTAVPKTESMDFYINCIDFINSWNQTK